MPAHKVNPKITTSNLQYSGPLPAGYHNLLLMALSDSPVQLTNVGPFTPAVGILVTTLQSPFLDSRFNNRGNVMVEIDYHATITSGVTYFYPVVGSLDSFWIVPVDYGIVQIVPVTTPKITACVVLNLDFIPSIPGSSVPSPPWTSGMRFGIYSNVVAPDVLVFDEIRVRFTPVALIPEVYP
jgi:hypothetical protein